MFMVHINVIGVVTVPAQSTAFILSLDISTGVLGIQTLIKLRLYSLVRRLQEVTRLKLHIFLMKDIGF